MAHVTDGHSGNGLCLSWLRPVALAAFLYGYASLGLLRKMPPFSLWVSVLLVVALVAWTLWVFVGRRCPTYSPLHVPALVFVAATGVSALLSADRRTSLDGLLYVVTLTFVYILACEVLSSAWEPRTIVRALMLLIGAVMVQAGGAIVVWYRDWLSLHVPGYPVVPVEFRVFGIADWPTQLSGLVNLGLPFALVGLLDDRVPRLSRLASAVWLALADVVLVYTSSRGGWVGSAIVATVVIVWLGVRDGVPPYSGWPRWVWSRRRLYLTLVPYFVVFVALVYVNKELAPSSYSTNAGTVLSGAGRLVFWRVALRSFLSSPLVGVGPFTYAQHYIASIPSAGMGWVSPHAHNIVLNIFAEQGILGAITGGWVLYATVLVWWRAARPVLVAPQAPYAASPGLVFGAGAAFIACLAHCQVDLLTRYPVTGACLVLLAAAVARAGGQVCRFRAGRHASTLLASGMVVAVALLVVLSRGNQAHAEYLDALISAEEGDWEAAAVHLDAAVALEPDIGVYTEQRAYAYGVLASAGQPRPADALAEATRGYRRALAVLPPWVPDLLNAAVLLDRQGDTVASTRLLERAHLRGDPYWPLASLLYARALADQGETQQGKLIIERMLEDSQWMAHTAGCRGDAVCSTLAPLVPASDVVKACEWAAQLLAQERPDEALQALSEISFTERSAAPWIGRAEAHLALDQVIEAEYALELASVLTQNAPTVPPSLARVRALLFLEQGHVDRAVAVLEDVVRPRVTVTRYHMTTFGRLALPGLLLPELDVMLKTPEDHMALQLLAQLYDLQNRPEDVAWARLRSQSLASALVLKTEP